MAEKPKSERRPRRDRRPGKTPVPRDVSRFWAEYLAGPEAARPEPLPGQGELFEGVPDADPA